MSYLTEKHFWAQATERAIKTGAQVALSLLVVSVGGLIGVGYGPLLSIVGLAVVISYLTSVVSGSVSPVGSPSLVDPAPPAPDPVPLKDGTQLTKIAADGTRCPPGC